MEENTKSRLQVEESKEIDFPTIMILSIPEAQRYLNRKK